MSASTRHAIFNYLDSAIKILVWTRGELLLILGPFFLGVFFDAFMLGIAIGILNYFGIRTYEKRFGKGKLEAVMYWYLPRIKKLLSLPASDIREYLS